MSAATLTVKQRFALAARRFKDRLGYPVQYRDHEFLYFKQRTDWSQMASARIALLSRLFCTKAAIIRTYAEEAESIAIETTDEELRAPNKNIGNPMGRTDCVTLYAVIRATKPAVALETGTAAGVSAVYILKAMEMNGKGLLYSIDSAPDHTYLGCMIPEPLRKRLTLCNGNSLALMPIILSESGGIDFFLHDSLHTYEHMMAEFELFFQHARQREGVICSHDILMTNAWKHFIGRHRLSGWGVLKNMGICRIDI